MTVAHPGSQDRSGADEAPRLLVVSTVSATIRGFLLPFAEHYRSLGWHVEAAAHGAPDDERVVGAFDAVHDLPLSRSILDLPGILRGTRAIRELIEQTRPTIVHVHTPIAGFATRVAARRCRWDIRPKVVYTAHGFHFQQGGHPIVNRLFLTAEQVAGRWTDRLVVINQEDRDAALRHHIVPASRLVLMPGIGVDTDHYAHEAAGALPGELAHDLGDAPVFVQIAELSDRKRPIDPIEALARMRSGGAHLVLLGDGPRRPEVVAAAQRLGVADRVHVVGSVGDVRPYLRDVTALVLVSSREGLPRSIMEAASMGVPAIATRIRGNTDLVRDDAGVLVEVGDVGAIAHAMDDLAAAPAHARAMGAVGRRRMVEQYSLGQIVELHDRLYGTLLGSSLSA